MKVFAGYMLILLCFDLLIIVHGQIDNPLDYVDSLIWL